MPSTSCNSLTGAVISDSIVPLRYSSEIARILMAGTMTVSIHGVQKNTSRSEAGLPGEKLPVQSTATPVISRNPAITM